MAKSRAETTDKILQALGRVLSRDGVRGVGINAVAREAGVDKVLIYRYFGGMEELLRTFAEQKEIWPSESELEGGDGDGALPAEVLVRYARALRARPNTQEILRWELLERNELTDSIAELRGQLGARILARIPKDGSRDLSAIATLACAGLTYLALRARSTESAGDLPLRTDEGWQRLEEATRTIWKLASSAEPDAQEEQLPAPPRKKRKLRREK